MFLKEGKSVHFGKMKLFVMLLGVIAAVILLQVNLYAAYEIKDMGTLGGTNSQPEDINEKGQVVGCSDIVDYGSHAFVWENGVMKDVGTLGSNFSHAKDINEKGQVVGFSGSLGDCHAFVWENGVMKALDRLEGIDSSANGINEKGQVVGSIETPGGFATHAFIWENGVMKDLGTLGGRNSEANGINEKGQVVGYSFIEGSDTPHAFIWENGEMKDLGTLGGMVSHAKDINEKGQVVGYSTTKSGESHAFIWENGEMKDLGTLGGNYSVAKGINEKGQVIGDSTTAGSERSHAFIWENGEMKDLGDTLGENISHAEGINDKGQVVGNCFSEKNYYIHALIWEDTIPTTSATPTPGGIATPNSETPELLQNSSFTYNTAGWYFWTQDGAVASGTRDTTVYESVYGSSDAAYKIDCTSNGSALNHIQLFTSGLKVEAGKTYKLSFMAKSEGGNANPLIALMQKSSPWAYYAKSSTVTIDSEWKLYNVYFTSNKSDNEARLTFFLGNRIPEGGKLYFDSLSFKEYSELLVNPRFEKGVGSWYVWTQSGATAIGTRNIGVFDSSPAGYRINCTTKGTDISHIQLFTWGIKVNEGKRYRLTFRAKSEGGKVTPLVRLMQKDSPWKSYAASNQVSIGSDWNTYEVYFDCNTTDSNARLTFFLGYGMPNGSKLFLDSMSMVEVIK